MSRDTSFYYSFLVLPRDRREAMITVWDFCRAVDDGVDEAPDRARAEAAVTLWRFEVERVFTGILPATPQGRALQTTVRRFDLSRQPFEDLVDGVAMDLEHARYPTFAALTEYCWRVASTVGIMCVEVFGCRDAASREYAHLLGLALQLTNIIRDVPGDYARGRIYLPQDDLRRHGVSEAQIGAGAMTPGLRALLTEQCARARSYYQRAADAFPSQHRRQLVAARIMGEIYFRVLGRIEARDYDVFGSRVTVPRRERAWVAASLFARTKAGLA